MNIVGFTTHGRKTGSSNLSGRKLAIRDLQNHFGTRRGERVNEPDFGSDLPLLLFEQLDGRTEALIDEDVKRVISSENRWQFVNYKIERGEHSVTVNIDLVYLPREEGVSGAVERVSVTYAGDGS